jgi:hypothetical protein
MTKPHEHPLAILIREAINGPPSEQPQAINRLVAYFDERFMGQELSHLRLDRGLLTLLETKLARDDERLSRAFDQTLNFIGLGSAELLKDWAAKKARERAAAEQVAADVPLDPVTVMRAIELIDSLMTDDERAAFGKILRDVKARNEAAADAREKKETPQ